MTDHNLTDRHAISTTTVSRPREEGQTMAEYGLMLGVIVIAVVAAIGALSIAFGGALEAAADAIFEAAS
jgi:Flp pilus assembly pilin Flp